MSEYQVGKASVRIRVHHTHTLKDGWRLNETTVEVDGVEAAVVRDGDSITFRAVDTTPLLKKHLDEAFAVGAAEADRRNAEDRVELTGDRLTVR